MREAQRYRRALEGVLGTPATEGNEITPLRNGDEIFPAMLDAIRGATATVDMLTFIYWTGEVAVAFADALTERARNGVRVRLILDTVGSRFMDNELIAQIEDAGAHIHHFRPPPGMSDDDDDAADITKLGHRTHRKVLICDEAVAFTGGVGIAEEWEGDARDHNEWRDSHFRIRGPAVDGLRAAFVDDWFESGQRVFDEHDRFPEQPQSGDVTAIVVRGEAEYGWSDIAVLKHTLLCLAQDRVRITTAYFSPDEHSTRLLCETARRGVEVEVLMPGEHTDKRLPQVAGELAYEPLLEAGVRIFRYEATMLHAKVMTVDGIVADVGSANFNSRSMSHDEEVDVVAFDPTLTALLDAHFDTDLRRAVRVEDGDWNARGPLQRAQEKVVDAIDGLV